jgi:hypothetical protein
MSTPQFPENAGIADVLAVTVQSSPQAAAEYAAVADSLNVVKWALPQVPPQGTPVNANPYFGTGGIPSGAGWNGFNGTFAASASPPAGCPQLTAGQYVNNGITAGAMEENAGPFPLLAGTSCLVTAWVYSSVPSVSIGFDWQSAVHGFISTGTATYSVPVNTWVPLSVALNPPWTGGTVPVFAYPRIGSGTLSATIWATQVLVTYQAPAATSPAPAVFVRSTMPVMHIQNLLTGQWRHRDVQGTSQPAVTWNLDAADTFTVTLSPPRPDMMTPAGEPLLTEWRDACYLEEDGNIKFGGILVASTFNGPAWQQSYMGFGGYPNGIPYEGANYTVTFREAMDVVRYLWAWVQAQESSIGMTVTAANTGVQLGAELPSLPVTDVLGEPSRNGQSTLWISHPDNFQAGMVIRVGDEGTTYVIKSLSNHVATLTTTLKGATSRYYTGAPIAQVVSPTPFQLLWYNSTDIGNEIEQIRQEAVFDWRETHTWSDSATKAGVSHRLDIGVPRLGSRRTDLRFTEGENIIQPATVTRDGTAYATRVVALGYGSGSATVRADVNARTGNLNRTYIYTDAALTTAARASAAGQKVLASMANIDAVTQVVVMNHPHAPFGSFFCGDDILVTLCTGWRNTSIWSRITSITQDPTTNLMTLGLARSDSFSYLAESGQGGTL